MSFGYSGGPGYRKTRKQTNYNKEQFLQAKLVFLNSIRICSNATSPDSCQFVVKEDGDYSVHITQSDLLVDWNNIEQVVSVVVQ